MNVKELADELTILVSKVLQPKKILPSKRQLINNPPCRTIYISNLNEKIKLDKLKEKLFQLCVVYGVIVNISCLNSYWRRGQAFISFDNVTDAKNAIANLHLKIFEGKQINCAFAREESHCFLSEDELKKVKNKTIYYKPLSIRLCENEIKHILDDIIGRFESLEQTNEIKKVTIPITAKQTSIVRGTDMNKTLLLEDYDETNKEIKDFISKLDGFVRIRSVPSKKLALVDFTNPEFATKGLDMLLALDNINCKVSILRAK